MILVEELPSFELLDNELLVEEFSDLLVNELSSSKLLVNELLSS